MDLERVLPDLVMTDMRLPGRSGKEVVEKMRSVEHLVDVPAILMTGSFPDSETFPDKESYQGILEKPFDLEELKETVNHLVS